MILAIYRQMNYAPMLQIRCITAHIPWYVTPAPGSPRYPPFARSAFPLPHQPAGSNTSKMQISSGSGCAASLTRTGSPQYSMGERSWAKGGSIDGMAAITAALNPSH